MTTTVVAKNLVAPKYAEDSDTTQYTATGVTAIVDKCTVTNVTVADAVITINIVPDAGAVDASNAILFEKTVPAGKTYTCPEIVGHSLDDTDYISTLADTASALVIDISGREQTVI